MSTKSKLFAVPALVAAFSMAAVPAEARVWPASPAGPVSAASGAGDALSYHRYYRYRRGPSAGDVLAGVLILGGIAAVASAATRGERDRSRDRSYPPPRRGGWDYDDARTIDRAVDSCVRAVERDVRVESVDRVERTERGWDVRGSLYDGKAFTCSLGRDGRVESLDYAGRSRDGDDWDEGDRRADDTSAESDDRQYDDDRYARERSRQDGAAPAVAGEEGGDLAEAPEATYSGEPAPGETGDERPEYPGDPV